MKSIVYYISGHGYGHATRSIELINALLARRKDLFIHIRTSAPEWLFRLNLRERFSYQRVAIDVGAVQNTSLYIDKQKTFEQVFALYETADRLVAEESAFIRSVAARGIIADIPPLAFDIASAVGLPSIAVSNFSWDWIYAAYLAEMPAFADLIERIRASYRKADLLLRLPMHGDLTVFPHIQDIPLIARRAKLAKQEVLQRLGLDAGEQKTIILVALRAADLSNIDLTQLQNGSDFTFVTFALADAPVNFVNIPPDFIPFPELLHASDLAVSKPGYGMVSETIANRTPLLYISRDDFVEYEILVHGLNRWAVSQYLPRDQFLSGAWLPAIAELLEKPKHWPEVALHGAVAAADQVMAFLSR